MARCNRPKPYLNYVYAWRSGDTMFYIGRGTADRAWVSHANKDATQRRKRAGKRFSVRILKEGLSRLDAAKAEKSYILKHKPICNMQYLTKPASSSPWRSRI